MTYDQFIQKYVVSDKTYTSDEVKELIQIAWVDAVDEQVKLEGRCTNRNYSPWSCKNHDFHFTRHHDCPTPPDRECLSDCHRRCHNHQHWHPT